MKTKDKYILDKNGEPIPEPDFMTWAEWFERKGNRIVARTTIADSDVSTVFLSIDHNWRTEGPPILWETMVFGGSFDGEQDRCSGTRAQAEAMHKRMVERVKESTAWWRYVWAVPWKIMTALKQRLRRASSGR